MSVSPKLVKLLVDLFLAVLSSPSPDIAAREAVKAANKAALRKAGG